uniref:Uncharacterized protein TCIL3000_3_1630 n=1 Tax=Trypanosoma congolense (strain IL3000) TaxID=1068625 RepID=G0UK31_TRYCI|nr:unnamed protein product [Trypanosoma congolense IL3000]
MQEVSLMARCLPVLTVLQLSHSPDLFRHTAKQIQHKQLLSAPNLRKLVLNHVGVRSIWQMRAVVLLPMLEELHLDNNGIERLVLFADDEKVAYQAFQQSRKTSDNTDSERCEWFPKVNTLSLAQNELSSWGSDSGLEEVITEAFPGLKRLFLTGNRMPNLSIGTDSSNITEDFKSDLASLDYAYLRPLELLCVNENITLTDTCTLDAVRILCPHLTTFRITYSTMFPQWNETLGRMYVVASLPTVTTLNRGQVRAKERLDSEIFYIQRGMAARQQKEQGQETGNAPQGTLHYPLLDVLREKHKDVITVIYREGETASHDGTMHMMLNVTLRCDGFEETKKRVPSSMTVGKLKALVRAVYSVAPSDQQLSFMSGDKGVVEPPTKLDNELQSLSFYGMCDGAVIFVLDTSLRR